MNDEKVVAHHIEESPLNLNFNNSAVKARDYLVKWYMLKCLKNCCEVLSADFFGIVFPDIFTFFS